MTKSLWIQETFVNATKGYTYGDGTNWYEAFTDNRGKLFASLKREYGRAQNMYQEPGNKPCGWVFTKTVPYEDSRETYTREVWVSVREVPEGKRLVKTSRWIEVDA